MPLLTILLALLAAKLILEGVIAEERTMLCVYLIAGLTAFLLSLYCAFKMPQKKALWAMATAVTYGLVLLAGNMLFFGIGFQGILSMLSVILGGGALGSLMGAMRKRR